MSFVGQLRAVVLHKNGLEFRLAFKGTADIYLDRVLVTSYPYTSTGEIAWRLSFGEGEKLLWLKAFDKAGNVSSDVTATLTVEDINPPSGWSELIPSAWITLSPSITFSVRVTDDVSGLDPSSATFRYSADEGLNWSEWLTASVTLTTPLEGIVTASAVPVPEGTAGRIQFRIADRVGFASESPVYTTKVAWKIFLPLVSK